jgi:hypothetical protein
MLLSFGDEDSGDDGNADDDFTLGDFEIPPVYGDDLGTPDADGDEPMTGLDPAEEEFDIERYWAQLNTNIPKPVAGSNKGQAEASG